MTSHHWYRLCIDLSHDGDWLGMSYEVRSEAGPVATHVGPEPGPFDSHHDLLGYLIQHIEDRYGVQLRLL